MTQYGAILMVDKNIYRSINLSRAAFVSLIVSLKYTLK